jgi:hypothetical protein
MRNWICKVFDDNTIACRTQQKTKKILEAINNTVGKF